MKKLLCKFCGNEDLEILNDDKVLCKCGWLLTNPEDEYYQEKKMKEEIFSIIYQHQASIITKISRLRWEIDQALDKRDEEAFYRLTTKLAVLQSR